MELCPIWSRTQGNGAPACYTTAVYCQDQDTLLRETTRAGQTIAAAFGHIWLASTAVSNNGCVFYQGQSFGIDFIVNCD
jgi:hypothetical protein